MRSRVLDYGNEEVQERGQDEVNRTKKGADCAGKVMLLGPM